MLKKAVIVAAGLSSRLYPLTLDKPKCLLKINNEPIISRNIKLLKKMGIEEVIVVTGYLNKKIENEVGDTATFIYNPFYRHCNNMGSLYLAKHAVEAEPFIYLHGDVVITETLIKRFLEDANNNSAQIHLAVDFKETDEEAMKVKVNKELMLIESSKEIAQSESAGEWIGLAVIQNPKMVYEYIEEVLVHEKLNVYDTYAFSNIARDGEQIRCYSIHGENWMEIDFLEDYDEAQRMFR
ncbi:NTP transferase domain-containing protein [Lysinibacillus cavernae]|uniref:phosphocholine cytidylyltransferase family protein n=1 Tax=Lysinibacillus cavernae TaxID=2666135 RepID=UPI0018C248B7|nr:phosphocholine cytidylyltransferase family protein [Lysinibacillus cavernae]